MKFGIIEVGSTVTKACIYDNGNIESLDDTVILFKSNYSKEGKIKTSDIE